MFMSPYFLTYNKSLAWHSFFLVTFVYGIKLHNKNKKSCFRAPIKSVNNNIRYSTKAGICKHIAFIHIDNETKIQYIKVWNQDAGVY